MADKEVEAIQEVIGTPDQIRNMGIVAHIDHGKCVTPETRIADADGRMVEAEELFHEIQERGEEIQDREGEAYRPASSGQLFALNRQAGEVEESELLYACKREGGKTVAVTTSNGHTVSTTPEHKFLTLTSQGLMEFRRADALEENDIIVGARNLPAEPENDVRENLLRGLSDDYGFYIGVSDGFAERIDEHERGELYEMSDTGLKEDSFKHAVYRGQYRLRDIIEICDGLNIPVDELYKHIETLNYRGSDHRGEKSSLDMEFPSNLSPLFYIAGVFFGDGDLEGNITASSGEMQRGVQEAAEQLGLDPIVREFDNQTTRIEVGGKTLRKVLQQSFGYPEKDKAGSIAIAETVFKSADDDVSAFIRGYMDADGTVEPNRSAVSVTSKSTAMLEDLQLLLYRFDIASKLNRNNDTLYISGKLSLDNYEEIGFGLSKKQDRLEELIASAESAKIDTVPISGSKLEEIREKIGASQSEIFQSYRNYEIDEVGMSKRSLGKIASRFDELDEEGKASTGIGRMRALAKADTSFIRVESVEEKEVDTVYDFGVEEHHNFIGDGVIVHNTTLSDSLLARAGKISDELAGTQLFMDYDEQEQERGITIYSANISMVHEHEGDKILINLIDTPGHVDFGGDVTRAMRAVDGALVVVDSVDGVMPQTEAVLRQALEERVKPVLFINKVDRIINELQLSPEEMQNRFVKIISEVNKLIKKIAPEDIAEDWTVSVEDGTVAFGSALYNWATSAPFMEKSGVNFEKIYEMMEEEDHEGLAETAPVEEVVLNMVVDHLPNPAEAQEYRIPQIWGGDTDSDIGQQMLKCDSSGDLVCVVTNVESDPHAGTISTARIFSGTVHEGDNLYGVGSKSEQTAQQVGIYSGPRKLSIDEVPSGNIVALTGADYGAGETVVSEGMTLEPFEQIEHIFEPVVTKSLEPRKTSDLPKLIEALRKRAKEDNTIQISIDEETGETLVSGLGELHIEAKVERYLQEQGIDIDVSEPIVVYRESVSEASEEFEGKSPNRHNKFYLTVEPLDEEVHDNLMEGEIPEGKVRSQDEQEVKEALVEWGMDKEEAENVDHVYKGNLFLDMSRGVQYLNEVRELVHDSFKEIVDEGPLASEPCIRLKVKIHDASLHEDAVHRGPAQVMPAVKEAITKGMLDAEAKLFEPKQIIRIDTPADEMGGAMTEVSNRRGDILNMDDEEDSAIIKAKVPVAEMFGFEADLKSSTGGKGFYSLIDQVFEPLPHNLQEETILEIRERKGMKQELPSMGG